MLSIETFRFDYLARCSSSAAESALYEVLLLGEALRALDGVAARMASRYDLRRSERRQRANSARVLQAEPAAQDISTCIRSKCRADALADANGSVAATLNVAGSGRVRRRSWFIARHCFRRATCLRIKAWTLCDARLRHAVGFIRTRPNSWEGASAPVRLAALMPERHRIGRCSGVEAASLSPHRLIFQGISWGRLTTQDLARVASRVTNFVGQPFRNGRRESRDG
jgi:hypothetical protein